MTRWRTRSRALSVTQDGMYELTARGRALLIAVAPEHQARA